MDNVDIEKGIVIEDKQQDTGIDRSATDKGTNECPICLLEILPEEELQTTECCKKEFHQICLSGWLETGKNTCPCCRSVIGSTATDSEAVAQTAQASQLQAQLTHDALLAYLIGIDNDYQQDLQDFRTQMEQRVLERRVTSIEKQRYTYYLTLVCCIPSIPCVVISFFIWILLKFSLNFYMILGFGACTMIATLTIPYVTPACNNGPIPNLTEYYQAHQVAYGEEPRGWRKRHWGF